MAVKKAAPKPAAKKPAAPKSAPKPAKAHAQPKPHMPGFSSSESAYGKMMGSAHTLIKNRKK